MNENNSVCNNCENWQDDCECHIIIEYPNLGKSESEGGSL